MINRVVLVGRLTRDPELRTTNTGKSVVSFSIAVNKRTKPQDPNQPDADFFRCSAWERTAEYVSNYLTKGRLVAVEGRLETRKYTDNSGNQREVVEVICDNVQGLDRPRDDAGGSGDSHGGYSGGGRQSASVAPAADEFDPFADE